MPIQLLIFAPFFELFSKKTFFVDRFFEIAKELFGFNILIAALKDSDEDIRSNAIYTLRTITGEDFGEDQERWKKWWEENKEKFLKKK